MYEYKNIASLLIWEKHGKSTKKQGIHSTANFPVLPKATIISIIGQHPLSFFQSHQTARESVEGYTSSFYKNLLYTGKSAITVPGRRDITNIRVPSAKASSIDRISGLLVTAPATAVLCFIPRKAHIPSRRQIPSALPFQEGFMKLTDSRFSAVSPLPEMLQFQIHPFAPPEYNSGIYAQKYRSL